MVHVANRAYVDVRFGPLKFAFCHCLFSKEQARVQVLRLHDAAGSSRTGNRTARRRRHLKSEGQSKPQAVNKSPCLIRGDRANRKRFGLSP
jgi:hypothetical protein